MKNIVYLHTHDSGRCISPYGYKLDTPNLEKFARENAIFRQAFDCGPTCSPARAALLTGEYPHQCGMMGLAHRGFEINDPQKHLVNLLKNNGYETILCGIQHETHQSPTVLGYNIVIDKDNEMNHRHDGMGKDQANSDVACAFINQKHEKPFFLSLGLFSTHRAFPVEPDAEDNPNYMQVPAQIPDTPECRQDWAAFATMARHADRCFGQVLDTLKANNLLDDTLILITTDHGVAFPRMKCNLNDSGCGVMFMLHVPNMTHGECYDQLITHMDFYPTVCDWLGCEKPAHLQGKSLINLLNGSNQDLHDEIFAEINFHAAKDVQRTVRTKRYRYVKRFDSYEDIIYPNMDDGMTKTFLLEEADLKSQKRIPREQLFDIYNDPNEVNSVIEDPEYSEILNSLRAKLNEWMKYTNDPLYNQDDLITPSTARLEAQNKL